MVIVDYANIVIIGLGNVGTSFLKRVIHCSDLGLRIVCVVEPNETKGKKLAQNHAIAVADLDDMIGFGVAVDLIFDLTGDKNVWHTLKSRLADSGNQHTELISQRAIKAMWNILTDEPAPGASPSSTMHHTTYIFDL
ncbi:MAG: hypothetical protein COS35_04785 [Zetaproteobacteria bacterium CG02_land_8_20_14_3_00_50_9]|nr:MAG: hypothetical protein AUJ57_02330 [Zetaproteobacteria bacterium CG1_02_53_45]PIQ32372.1 MAG: hypothetical protein COW62_07720 [Zetaproteobacteria bacterium CG17_big_fil_post_rev_8_21_14_2_50_50_13]PIV30794.1 MAG: hypothetical protein COS35_04785 [Zetaproteobacteria bacterium CG02_land_8_20_14_3_00_50_9]PIY54684.1 MAG: hypothetical protein COZ00_13390 [Zetaproteobacteria bacterium CG_4_10_14_0_8_um_filter_49_80]